MLETLAKILPLDLASAMSPIILALCIVLLAKKEHGLSRVVAMGVGSLIVAVALAILGMKLGQNVQDLNNTSAVDNIVDLILAVLFLYFGIRGLTHKENQHQSKVLEKSSSRQLAKWFLIGFVISATNFDAVMLNFSAAKEIGQTAINYGEKIILLIIGGIFFTLPILLPLTIFLAVPKLAQKILNPIDAFLGKYGRYIVAVIFLGFAIYLFYKGISGF